MPHRDRREFHKSDAEVAASLLLTLPFDRWRLHFACGRPLRPPLAAHARSVFYSVVEVASGLAQLLHVPGAASAIGIAWRRVGVAPRSPWKKCRSRLRGVLSGSCNRATPPAICWPPSAFSPLPRFGWRPLFFVAAAGAAGAVRAIRVKESEVWNGAATKAGATWAADLSHWKLFLY